MVSSATPMPKDWSPNMSAKPSILMVGTGEYTTGYVNGTKADSDKSCGVVGLVMFDLREKGIIADRLVMVGVNGTKFPGIRSHLAKCIGETYSLDTSFESFPSDDAVDAEAYKQAISTMSPGDIAFIFTPDDTHYTIASACIAIGMHVMVTKPVVKTLAEHRSLSSQAKDKGIVCAVEVHKRLDPMYADVRNRIQSLGNFQYINAYMSQPKHQLKTFAAWAGKSSDISYYLNSHHVDFTQFCLQGRARAVRVVASASTGVAKGMGFDTEDSITLLVTWENFADGSSGTGVYTSSWVAPKSDVHTQQRFSMMTTTGEIMVDQSHRGFTVSTDEIGFASCNPLYMIYTPKNGKFVGQSGYGVRSLRNFIDSCISVNAGDKTADDVRADNASVHDTMIGTAILEAGRRSLDAGGKPMDIVYGEDREVPVDIVETKF